MTQGLAATRALENGIFVAMANRVGEEELAPGLSFTSLGHSCIDVGQDPRASGTAKDWPWRHRAGRS